MRGASVPRGTFLNFPSCSFQGDHQHRNVSGVTTADPTRLGEGCGATSASLDALSFRVPGGSGNRNLWRCGSFPDGSVFPRLCARDPDSLGTDQIEDFLPGCFRKGKEAVRPIPGFPPLLTISAKVLPDSLFSSLSQVLTACTFARIISIRAGDEVVFNMVEEPIFCAAMVQA